MGRWRRVAKARGRAGPEAVAHDAVVRRVRHEERVAEEREPGRPVQLAQPGAPPPATRLPADAPNRHLLAREIARSDGRLESEKAAVG